MLADDGIAVVCTGDDAVLHVDDDQGGVRSVRQGGHDGLLVAAAVAARA